jgi:hypothetical protein
VFTKNAVQTTTPSPAAVPEPAVLDPTAKRTMFHGQMAPVKKAAAIETKTARPTTGAKCPPQPSFFAATAAPPPPISVATGTPVTWTRPPQKFPKPSAKARRIRNER